MLKQVSDEESFAEVNFTGCDESDGGSSEDESSRSKITAVCNKLWCLNSCHCTHLRLN